MHLFTVRSIRLAVLSLFAGLAFAQAPVFEVVSIKKAPDDTRWARQVNPQRFFAVTHLSSLICWAFDLKAYQILGAPSWLGSETKRGETFEFQATTGRSETTEAEIKRMVQTLLSDRFQMKFHRQVKEIPIFALVVSKKSPLLAPAKPGSPSNIHIGPGVMFSTNTPMAVLAGILTENLDRPVIDKTDLTGGYDFRITFDELPPPPGFTWSPIGASIFTPLKELGLKLDPQKAVVEMVVIDSIDHPSEN